MPFLGSGLNCRSARAQYNELRGQLDMQAAEQCKCPKHSMHQARSEFEPRNCREMEAAVKNVALKGLLPGSAFCTKAGSCKRKALVVSYRSVHTEGLRRMSQAPRRSASY